MIYGHVPRWTHLQNPAFDEAMTRYYSLEHGSRHAWRKKGERPAHLRDGERIAPP